MWKTDLKSVFITQEEKWCHYTKAVAHLWSAFEEHANLCFSESLFDL